MKFVVKEFLSVRLVGLPRGRRPSVIDRGRTVSHSSFPGNGEDSRRPGPPKASEKCPIRFKSRDFLPFVASDGARRVTAGKEIPRLAGPMRGELYRLHVAR